jgi:cell division protein FtsB
MRYSLRLVVDVIAPAVFICWIGYFSYGAVVGATGVRALRTLEAEVQSKSSEVAELAAERRRLQIVADQLNPNSLDPDMAEEKIRTVLGYAEEGDLVISRDQLEEILNRAAQTKAGG